VLQVGGEEL